MEIIDNCILVRRFKNLLKSFLGSEFLRFAVVGVVSTILHYGTYLLLVKLIPTNASYTIGYIIGFVANFFLTNFFTFHTLPSLRNLFGMAGAHGVNYVLHMVLLNLFLFIGVPEKFAPIPVYCIAVPVNYLLVRYFFKSKTNQKN